MDSELVYYPGCSLPFRAQELESSVRRILSELGIRFNELPSWNCCGGLISKLDFKSLIGPCRILISAWNLGKKLLTICPFCYNTFKRANQAISQDPLTNKRVNSFLESQYNGQLQVIHLLELLRDLGFQLISERIINPLNYKVGCYYGCMLLRPRSIALDDPESPQIMQQLMMALGAQPVEFPYAIECCGSYLVIQERAALRISAQILSSALRAGAQLIATSCPLCSYNLNQAAQLIKARIPVIYFTQLLESALTGAPLHLG